MNFSTEDLDLQKEMHPLNHYVDDREELLEQMFATMSGDRLQTILPSFLKGFSLEELKKKCLQQLLLLPREKILELVKDSTSEEEEQVKNEPEPEEVAGIASNSEEELEIAADPFDAIMDQIEQEEIEGGGSELERVSEREEDSIEWLSSFTKTQMEILELEMRARAIRSLMKAQGLNVNADSS